MREMKDSGVSWIGEIPADWEVRRIKYVAQCSNEKAPYAGQRYIGLENIESWAGKIVGVTETSSIESTVSSFSETSVLFAKLRPYLAKVALPDFSGQCSTELLVLSPTKIRREYLFWNLICSGFIETVSKSVFGAKMPRTDWDYIGGCFIPYPTMSQQRHIAAYLDTKCAKIDAIISRQQQVIEKLKAYKLSVITEAVTKGLNSDVPMKDSGIEWIGMIPAHWDILKLQAHTRMLTPMRDRPEKLDGDIPWVRIEDYDGKYISASKEGLGVSPETVQEMNLKIYPIGSILCTSSCDLGKCAIVTRELVSNQRFINIIPDSDTNSDYLYYLMLSNAERLNHLSTGTIQANLSRKAFEHLMVQFPPNSEQAEIAEYLDRKCAKIEFSISIRQELIDSLSAYKKSLIYEVVTGKREIDADLPQATTVAVVSPELFRYMKAVLMARLIDGLGDHVLGRVQVQKGLYFAETSSNPRLHLETDYTRYTHGPFDREIWDYEAIMAEHGWIYASDEPERTIYKRGEHFSEYWDEYQRLFPGCEETVQRIIDFVKQFQYTDGVEKAATLFAAWNDFIIDGVTSPTDEEIIAEVRNHWTENKGKIKERTWKKSLAQLKNAQFIPQGYGKHTVRWQGGQAHG